MVVEIYDCPEWITETVIGGMVFQSNNPYIIHCDSMIINGEIRYIHRKMYNPKEDKIEILVRGETKK